MIHQCYFAEAQRSRLFDSPLYRGFGLYTEVNPDIARNCPELATPANQPLLSEYGAMLHLWRNPELDPDPWIGFTSYRQLDKFSTVFRDRAGLEDLLKDVDVIGWGAYRFHESTTKRPLTLLDQGEMCHPGITSCLWKMLAMRHESLPASYLTSSVGLFCDYWMMSKANFDEFMRWSFPLIRWCLNNPDPFVQSHPRSLAYLAERLFICRYALRPKTVIHVGHIVDVGFKLPQVPDVLDDASPAASAPSPGQESFIALRSWNATLLELCQRHRVAPRGIIHIGAHYAEEREIYRQLGARNILWIEADPNHLPQLQANIAAYPGHRALQACLSDVTDQVTPFYRTNNRGESSSILPMGTHSEEFRNILVTEQTTLTTSTFAKLVEREALPLELYDFLVLDVQGAELLVLQGFEGLLSNFDGVYLEVNIHHLYQGCALLADIDAYMQRQGLVRRETLITQQHYGDALYLREGRFEPPPANLHERNLRALNELKLKRTLTYQVAGQGRRTLEFMDGGWIGEGKGPMEQRWMVRPAGHDVLLEIVGAAGRTCFLRQQADGLWRGQQLFPPYRAIELGPIATPLREATRQGYPFTSNFPLELGEQLRDAFQLKHFIETGTYLGTTTRLAAPRFQHVYTIEVVPSIHARTATELADCRNVRCLLGDTVQRLPPLLREIDGPALFWLDAHWSGGVTGKSDTECPLLKELQVIYAHRPDHVVLIDDARLFLAPPPPPHQPGDWPAFTIIQQFLASQQPPPYVHIVQDVIVIVPPQAACLVEAYCREQGIP